MATTWRPAPELAQRLRIVSALTGRSANAIISEAVARWLDENEPPEAAALSSRPESATEHPHTNS